MEGSQSKTTWAGEASSSKGSHSWGIIDECSGKSAQPKGVQLINSVTEFVFLHEHIGVGDLSQHLVLKVSFYLTFIVI